MEWGRADGVLYLALNLVGLALPAHSLALPFACSAEPLTRSLSFHAPESCYQENVSATFPAIAAKDGDEGASQILHCHVANLQRSPVPNSFVGALGARGGSMGASARA